MILSHRVKAAIVKSNMSILFSLPVQGEVVWTIHNT